jgi:hypothetical protein
VLDVEVYASWDAGGVSADVFRKGVRQGLRVPRMTGVMRVLQCLGKAIRYSALRLGDEAAFLSGDDRNI